MTTSQAIPVNEISADVVEAAWRETAAFSEARGRGEMERLGREQPDLLAYVLGATHEGGTLFLVLKTAIDVLHEARERPRRH
jgi:hypothetical protein